MKKTMFVFAIFAIALLVLSPASSALAAEPLLSGPGDGNGHQGELGTGTGVPVDQNFALDGAMDDVMHESLATALVISPAELAARLDAGETVSQIGLSLGFDLATISEILTQARFDALAQAVANELITQEQADWLASRINQAPVTSDGICDGTGDCISDGTGDDVCDGIGDGVCDDTGECIPDGTFQNTMSKNSYVKGFGSK